MAGSDPIMDTGLFRRTRQPAVWKRKNHGIVIALRQYLQQIILCLRCNHMIDEAAMAYHRCGVRAAQHVDLDIRKPAFQIPDQRQSEHDVTNIIGAADENTLKMDGGRSHYRGESVGADAAGTWVDVARQNPMIVHTINA